MRNYKNIFIIENLCPSYKRLFNKLRTMRNNEEIYNVWPFNGMVNFKFSEYGFSKNVYYLTDIEYYIHEDFLDKTADDE